VVGGGETFHIREQNQAMSVDTGLLVIVIKDVSLFSKADDVLLQRYQLCHIFIFWRLC
jgi:hypothetical protein